MPFPRTVILIGIIAIFLNFYFGRRGPGLLRLHFWVHELTNLFSRVEHGPRVFTSAVCDAGGARLHPFKKVFRLESGNV